MKKFFFIFLIFIPIVYGWANSLQISALSANPVFFLKGGNVTLSLSASPVLNVSKATVSLYNFSTGSTTILYNPYLSGNTYIWNFYVNDSADYRAQAILFTTYGSTVLSNLATFTTNIPAASVQSTIVIIPFISDNMPSYSIPVKNIGSKILSFTCISSPTGLAISPQSGQILPSESTNISISLSGFFLPGQNYTIDAILKTNDPRPNMANYLLARFLMGPDGIEITPVQISNTEVTVGSNVSVNFSILYHNVNISYVYLIWSMPGKTQTFNLPINGNDFSSSISTTVPGTYTLSTILVGYTYGNQNLQLVISPNLNVKVLNVPIFMNLNLINGTNEVSATISSTSTPTLRAIDNSTNILVNLVRSGQNWTGTYTYMNTPGLVTLETSFQGTQTVIAKSFNRYLIQGGQNLYFSDGWITIPADAFATPTIVALYSQNFVSANFYTGYSPFNQVSDTISAVSRITPAASFSYNLYFNTDAVNGLFNNVKIYYLNGNTWSLSSINPMVGTQMANFYAKTGTYALGLSAQILKGQSPSILSFIAVPNKLVGKGNIQFFLGVDKDCYYQIFIYDLRGKIVGYQIGTALKYLYNLVYSLNPSSLSNGLYTAVIGIGSVPDVFTQNMSIPFVIVK